MFTLLVALWLYATAASTPTPGSGPVIQNECAAGGTLACMDWLEVDDSK